MADNGTVALQLDYFYGIQSEMFSFLRIPKILIKDGRFEKMSNEAKMLFGLLLDRMSLSVKNRWFDEEDRVYIIYTKDEIMIDLNIESAKCAKLLKELENYGLIERIRRGLSKPNIIYVKNFATIVEDGNEQPKEMEKKIRERKEKTHSKKILSDLNDYSYEEEASNPINSTEVRKSNFKKFENQTSRDSKIELQEVRKSNFKEFENQTSRDSEIKLQEVRISNSNNINIINTDNKNTDINDIDVSNTDSLTHSLTCEDQDDLKEESEGESIYNLITTAKKYQDYIIEYDRQFRRYKNGDSECRPECNKEMIFEYGALVNQLTYQMFYDSRKKYNWSQSKAVAMARQILNIKVESRLLKEVGEISYLESELCESLVNYMSQIVGLSECIRINGVTLTPEYMGEKFFELNRDLLLHVIQTLRVSYSEVKNKKNYYIACLLNAKDHQNTEMYGDLKTILM